MNHTDDAYWKQVRAFLTELRILYHGDKKAPFARLVGMNRNGPDRIANEQTNAKVSDEVIVNWLAHTSKESRGQFFSRVERRQSWVAFCAENNLSLTSPVMPTSDTLREKPPQRSGDASDAAAANGFGVSTEKLVAKVLFHLGYVLVGASQDPRVIEAIRLRDAAQTEGRGGDAAPLRADISHFPRVEEK